MDTIVISAKITTELARTTEGITSRKLAAAVTLDLRQVNEALAAMEAAGTVASTPGARKGAELWTLATPTATDADASTDADTIAPDAEASTDADTPTDTNTDDVAPVSGAPTSGAPVGSADHFKIVMVAGVLGDHPDGVSAADLSDETGLRAAIVAKVLVAMETAGAAARKPAEAEGGVELWVRSEGDLATVDLTNAPTFTECPTCGHRTRVRATVGARRVGTGAPGHNTDGSPVLGKNELRNMVRDFLNAHPGHVFNAGTISRELGRSSGAIGNALAKLVVAGEADLVSETPMRYSAPATTTAPGTDEATSNGADTDATVTDEAATA
jgi:hypothetical protein